MTLLIVFIILSGLNNSAFAQKDKKQFCYINYFSDDEKIFNRMDVYPNYKGYTDKLNQFIINQINVDRVLNSLLENTRLLIDTIDVKFVISKTRQMSNLAVNAHNKVVEEEVRQTMIKSSCNWEPGSSSGRFLNGWFEKN